MNHQAYIRSGPTAFPFASPTPPLGGGGHRARALGLGRVVRPLRRLSRGALVGGGRFLPFFARVASGELGLSERVARDQARQDAQALDPDTLLFVVTGHLLGEGATVVLEDDAVADELQEPRRARKRRSTT